MAEEKTAASTAAEDDSGSGLDAGTYEVLSKRLADFATELTERAESLNDARTDAFGGTELSLLGTTRIRTANNCVPRDMVQVGGHLLFGYNVHMGLKSHAEVGDVFALHEFNGEGGEDGQGRTSFSFAEVDTDGHVLDDPRFVADFTEMYRYYRSTELLQVRQVETRLLAVFRIGEKLADQRVLRWQLRPDGSAEYMDARGDSDNTWPESYDFEWTETTRDDHVTGRHPHVSVEDEIFVECLNGTLTIKVEDNTETGEGIFSEPVDEPLQSLADAQIAYARVGPLLLLKILPYNEASARHLVYNTRTGDVQRADAIGTACRRLPEDHGIIFPGGYYLNEGKLKTFDHDTDGLRFKRVIRSPNGEDVLFVFYHEVEGRSLLLPYNVIRKEVAAPMSVHGFSIFDDGTLAAFRFTGEEATRVHPVQVWRTPFVSESHAADSEASLLDDSGDAPADRIAIARVGNAEAVRAVSDALSVARMVREMEPGQAVFEALIAAATRCLDDYPWLGDDGLHALDRTLRSVRETAESVLDEYATVAELTAEADKALDQARTDTVGLLRRARGEAPKSAEDWVALLTDLRGASGHLVTLRDVRYIDADSIGELEAELTETLESTGRRAVAYLEREDSFAPYFAEIEALEHKAERIETVAEAEPLAESLDERQRGLETLTEVVSTLEIGDATVRTGILGRVSEVLAAVNRTRATLAAHRRELAEGEGRAEFAAEYALLGQAVTAALAAAGTPADCDEQLGRLLLTIENLETRFADFDDFLAQLADKRTDVYEAFSGRKQNLLDEAARRAEQLAASADRILEAVARRTASLSSLDEVNTYFATDPMVERIRRVVAELRELDDTVRAEEIEGRIQSARSEAGRALQDQLDLFDGDAIRFGEHRIPVNTQPLDLTLVPSGDALAFSLTGTDYRQVVDDPGFADTRPYWSQFLPSENERVYRAEHLAASLLAEHGPAKLLASDLPAFVSAAAAERYDEGYERGVHDADAAAILAEVLRLHAAAGTLRYTPACRAAARLYWAHGVSKEDRQRLASQARSLSRVRETFGRPDAMSGLIGEIEGELAPFLEGTRLARHHGFRLDPPTDLAAEYLAEELAAGGAFAASARARGMLESFERRLGPASKSALDDDLRALDGDLHSQWGLAWNWLDAFVAGDEDEHYDSSDLPEALAAILTDVETYDVTAELTAQITGLLGTHPRVQSRVLPIRLDEFLTRTAGFRTGVVPGYRAYQRRRGEIIEAHKRELRVEEFKPKVMSGFVRNQLIDEVYLPLIGSNLAKQIGAGSGDARRTDQSGMLMLISPPGYGKTTLMEYVADRLGMLLVKVNGPALGHQTVSVDPADAPNATARQEVEKINFALECGNNVLLYLDDIQHTNPELLQKFISMCDAQRKMEGVWNGRTRTYDLRGKRFAVCMAGNPYTEAGQKFRIPDMLANRADVWNLGDVLSGRDEVFAQSYIENALTSNAVTAPLAGRERADVKLLLRLAADDPTAAPDDLHHPYPAGELDQVLSVLRKMLHLQRTVLGNNLAYIGSAAMDDSSRTEPPFLLQGSYRNMNRLAERVVPVMNDDELEAIIDDHYAGEAQTLASGAEANLLKLAELRDRLDEDQRSRWEAVKEAFRREQLLGGGGDDPMSRAVGAITMLSDRVGGIETALQQRTR